LSLLFLLGSVPCVLVLVMLAADVSKEKVALILAVPVGALAIISLARWLTWGGAAGETFPGWAMTSIILLCGFGPPYALLGLIALYQRSRSEGPGMSRGEEEWPFLP
jgi:hypothetical protein